MVRTGSTMQLTRAADYAVRVMIHLASLPPNERALLPELARATGSPGSFLSKVLQALGRAGLIDSRRGQSGGFEILDRGRRASMREVIEAIDGPIYINLCLISGASCERKSYCPAHPFWSKAQEAMLSVLNGAIVADLAAQATVPSPRDASGFAHLSDQSAAGKANS
jgi:Rrf2 family protein